MQEEVKGFLKFSSIITYHKVPKMQDITAAIV